MNVRKLMVCLFILVSIGCTMLTNPDKTGTTTTTVSGSTTTTSAATTTTTTTVAATTTTTISGPTTTTIPPLGTTFTKQGDYLVNIDITSVAVSDSIVIAGTSGQGIKISTNGGTSWTDYTTSTTPAIANDQINDIVIDGTNAYVGTFQGLTILRNITGATPAIENFTTGEYSTSIRSIAHDGTKLYIAAGTTMGTSLLVVNDKTSSASYSSPVKITTGMPAGIIEDIYLSGTTLWIAMQAATDGYASLGTIAKVDLSATPYAVQTVNISLTAPKEILVSGSTVLVGSDYYIQRSTNGGMSFIEGPAGTQLVTEIAASGSNVVLAQYGFLHYISTDLGSSWKEVIIDPDVVILMNDIAISGNKIFIAHFKGLRVGTL